MDERSLNEFRNRALEDLANLKTERAEPQAIDSTKAEASQAKIERLRAQYGMGVGGVGSIERNLAYAASQAAMVEYAKRDRRVSISKARNTLSRIQRNANPLDTFKEQGMSARQARKAMKASRRELRAAIDETAQAMLDQPLSAPDNTAPGTPVHTLE